LSVPNGYQRMPLAELRMGGSRSIHLSYEDDGVKITNDPVAFDPSGQVPKGATVVAAFEPFAGRSQNRSWEVVSRLPPNPDLIRVRLPVEFRALPNHIERIREVGPHAVLLVGEISARHVLVEAIALNILDSRRPDNAGETAEDRPLVPGAPLALRTRWDPAGAAAAIQAAGIRATTSFHAGTHACNAALYLTLHGLPPSTKVGFLHIPRRRWPRGPRTTSLIRAVSIALGYLRT